MDVIGPYDQLFFESNPSPERHLDRFYTIAVLCGKQPAPPDACRVLEIGCSTGLNLIPQAELYPGTVFRGIDPSQSQIERGNRSIAATGLQNITLTATRIEDLESPPESYDYIICHGVYSWVPDSVRAILMRRIGELLKPSGIAYLSYNTPGAWKRRATLRKAMLDNDRPHDPPHDRIASARSLVALAVEILERRSDQGSLDQAAIARNILRESDAILLHEYLNPCMETFTVTELNRRALESGLAYLADARPRRNVIRYLESLEQSALRDVLLRLPLDRSEDLFDLVEPRAFRAALLQKPGSSAGSSIDLRSLQVSSPLVPVAIGAGEGNATFMMGNEQPVEISSPPVARLISKLYESWPTPTQLGQLIAADSAVESTVRSLFWQQVIELSYSSFGCARGEDSSLRCSRFAQFQATQAGIITTLKHEHFAGNPIELVLIGLMDGNRTVNQLIDGVEAVIRQEGAASLHITRSDIADEVQGALKRLKEAGMLFDPARP